MTVFANAIKEESTRTYTENGAFARSTTGSACLDLFGCVGSLRETDETRIARLFADAYAENPLLAVKIAFYARDIRGGLGERNTFRVIIRYLADNHPEALVPNLGLIGEFGRFDDWYALVGTRCEDAMWKAMKEQFEKDWEAVNNDDAGSRPSLLAKWMKTADASSKNTRRLGILTARRLGLSVYDYKRRVKAIRKELRVVERSMSAGDWGGINYEAVPSRAMMVHSAAFFRHDEERFNAYINDVSEGKKNIHSGALFPYDIVEKYLVYGGYPLSSQEKNVLEAQWEALPDYVGGGENVVIMADVSGSMYGRPMATSVGLALYFARHNRGAYHNLCMTFSGAPRFVEVKGDTLEQQIESIDSADWGMNTNLEAAMLAILDVAVKRHIDDAEMPGALVVISDMEIDEAQGGQIFTDYVEEKFKAAGYDLPNIVYWNVNSRHDVFHTNMDYPGVQCMSGQSASTFEKVIDCIDMTPAEAMVKTLENPRYDCITIAGDTD
jgi:hypothetical protein